MNSGETRYVPATPFFVIVYRSVLSQDVVLFSARISQVRHVGSVPKGARARLLCFSRSFNGTLQVFRGESLPNLSTQLDDNEPIQSPT